MAPASQGCISRHFQSIDIWRFPSSTAGGGGRNKCICYCTAMLLQGSSFDVSKEPRHPLTRPEHPTISLAKLNIRILGVFHLFFLFERIFRFAFAVCIRNNLSPIQFGSSSSEHNILDCSRHDTQHFVGENRCQCPFHHPITSLGVHC